MKIPLPKFLEHWLFTAPNTIDSSLRRNFITVQVAFLFIGFVHTGLFVFFLFLQAPVLWIFNLLSVVFYLFLITVHRYTPKSVMGGMVFMEVMAHQFLCVLFLGLDSGFLYHLIAFGAGMIIYPFRRVYGKVVFPVLSIVGYVAIDLSISGRTPILQLDPLFLGILRATNVLVSFLILIGVVYFFERAAKNAQESLEKQKKIAEDLLDNILPTKIGKRLSQGEKLIADQIDGCSILFTDIVNFTQIAKGQGADDLVYRLNKLFSSFDDLVEKYSLEKIKTIGDAYMVASGVPEYRKDHAQILVQLAQDMILESKKHSLDDINPVDLRVGIHSGAAMAGVIGKKKFTYDIWGDTVNRASRMESHGTPGKVHISGETAQLIQADFTLEKVPLRDIKGLGKVQTYFVKTNPNNSKKYE